MSNTLLRTTCAALALSLSVATAHAQTGPGWTTLIDAGALSADWDKLGESNWHVDAGALVADKLPSTTAAFLLTKPAYKNFQLYAEFWASDDANSGIFIRCNDRTHISANTCYEVNIFDQRPDPTYGTGSIVYFAEVNPMPKAGGKWNTMLITANERHITVVFNGKKTADVRLGMLMEGPFALQHGAGVIKFRKVAIKPL